MKRQLGVRMQVFVELDQRRLLLFDQSVDGIRGVKGDGGEKCEVEQFHGGMAGMTKR
jgi:hypothetical protein